MRVYQKKKKQVSGARRRIPKGDFSRLEKFSKIRIIKSPDPFEFDHGTEKRDKHSVRERRRLGKLVSSNSVVLFKIDIKTNNPIRKGAVCREDLVASAEVFVR